MKNKKLLSILLSFAMLLPVFSLPITAGAAEAENDVQHFDFIENSKLGILPSGASITVDENAVKSARTALRNHEAEKVFGIELPLTTFSVTVKTSKYNDSTYQNEYAEALLNRAMAHTGNPIEGDYMSRQLNGYYYEFDDSKTGYLTITYTISFFTTKEQENEMDEKVDEIIKSLKLSGKTDYQKVKSIYDYLCENVVYDMFSYSVAMTTQGRMHNPVGHSAYGALCNGTAVCQGYAAAFYRLALEAGIDGRVIFGESSGGGHAWNIVKLDGKYYLLDSTWDAGQSEYEYFLKCEKDFPDHDPDDEHKTSSWKSKYPIASTSYKTTTVKTSVYDTMGDIDGDGKITSADSLLALRISVKLEKDAHSELADVDGNGKIDSYDALNILRYSVGLPTESNIGTKIK